MSKSLQNHYFQSQICDRGNKQVPPTLESQPWGQTPPDHQADSLHPLDFTLASLHWTVAVCKGRGAQTPTIQQTPEDLAAKASSLVPWPWGPPHPEPCKLAQAQLLSPTKVLLLLYQA
uniref:Uncharacterized protein n=1 Tax=Sphaerodactylus townsendi TaxID=933632 RepID=A0ACB8FZ77_9SAUR